MFSLDIILSFLREGHSRDPARSHTQKAAKPLVVNDDNYQINDVKHKALTSPLVNLIVSFNIDTCYVKMPQEAVSKQEFSKQGFLETGTKMLS